MTRMVLGEKGVTLVEVLIAMAILSIVIVSVDTSVSVLNARSNSMSQSTQAIDQLQVAEQTVVRDVHAATSWCNPTSGSPCTTFTQAPTATELKFNAVLDCTLVPPSTCWSNPTSFDISISKTAPYQLTITKGNSTALLASNLDLGTDPKTGLPFSGFTWKSVLFGTTTYYTSIGVTLTMDSPRVGAPRITTTTTADTNVEVWNAEYACQTAWRNAGSTGADPC